MELSLRSSTLSTASSFFSPISTSSVELLFANYASTKEKIDALHHYMTSDTGGHVLDYFTKSKASGAGCTPSFNLESAMANLNSTFWSMAMNLTDVYSNMPSADRDSWTDMIREHTTLPFDEDVVISTLQTLLNSREEFLCKRVMDIFKSLSGDHVTNKPYGFTEKMIISFAWNKTSYIGQINDLRTIIAKFMGRGPVPWRSTENIIDGIYATGDTGKWQDLDGGAVRIKVFKKETCHIEIHPDFAWRLNEILAILNPTAIPSEFRKPNKKKYKEFDHLQNLISPVVLDMLNETVNAPKYKTNEHGRLTNDGSHKTQFRVRYGNDKQTLAKVYEIYKACGGIATSRNGGTFEFDYDFKALVPFIIRSGKLPDAKSHQYYPTNDELGAIAAEWLDMSETDNCLEPSAGTGGLAKHMPDDSTLVEISNHHCEILKARGYNAINADFIEYATTAPLFDKILMNPPFDQGRAQQHFETAAKLLVESGELVAILPVSMKNKPELKGFEYEWSEERRGDFSGVSVAVILVKIKRTLYK